MESHFCLLYVIHFVKLCIYIAFQQCSNPEESVDVFKVTFHVVAYQWRHIPFTTLVDITSWGSLAPHDASQSEEESGRM